jgi:hypothetical protein
MESFFKFFKFFFGVRFSGSRLAKRANRDDGMGWVRWWLGFKERRKERGKGKRGW